MYSILLLVTAIYVRIYLISTSSPEAWDKTACTLPNTLIEDPSDCSKFYYCGPLGERYLFKCPGTSHFNRANQNCEWEGNVNCRKDASAHKYPSQQSLERELDYDLRYTKEFTLPPQLSQHQPIVPGPVPPPPITIIPGTRMPHHPQAPITPQTSFGFPQQRQQQLQHQQPQQQQIVQPEHQQRVQPQQQHIVQPQHQQRVQPQYQQGVQPQYQQGVQPQYQQGVQPKQQQIVQPQYQHSVQPQYQQSVQPQQQHRVQPQYQQQIVQPQYQQSVQPQQQHRVQPQQHQQQIILPHGYQQQNNFNSMTYPTPSQQTITPEPTPTTSTATKKKKKKKKPSDYSYWNNDEEFDFHGNDFNMPGEKKKKSKKKSKQHQTSDNYDDIDSTQSPRKSKSKSKSKSPKKHSDDYYYNPSKFDDDFERHMFEFDDEGESSYSKKGDRQKSSKMKQPQVQTTPRLGLQQIPTSPRALPPPPPPPPNPTTVVLAIPQKTVLPQYYPFPINSQKEFHVRGNPIYQIPTLRPPVVQNHYSVYQTSTSPPRLQQIYTTTVRPAPPTPPAIVSKTNITIITQYLPPKPDPRINNNEKPQIRTNTQAPQGFQQRPSPEQQVTMPTTHLTSLAPQILSTTPVPPSPTTVPTLSNQNVTRSPDYFPFTLNDDKDFEFRGHSYEFPTSLEENTQKQSTAEIQQTTESTEVEKQRSTTETPTITTAAPGVETKKTQDEYVYSDPSGPNVEDDYGDGGKSKKNATRAGKQKPCKDKAKRLNINAEQLGTPVNKKDATGYIHYKFPDEDFDFHIHVIGEYQPNSDKSSRNRTRSQQHNNTRTVQKTKKEESKTVDGSGKVKEQIVLIVDNSKVNATGNKDKSSSRERFVGANGRNKNPNSKERFNGKEQHNSKENTSSRDTNGNGNKNGRANGNGKAHHENKESKNTSKEQKSSEASSKTSNGNKLRMTTTENQSMAEEAVSTTPTTTTMEKLYSSTTEDPSQLISTTTQEYSFAFPSGLEVADDFDFSIDADEFKIPEDSSEKSKNDKFDMAFMNWGDEDMDDIFNFDDETPSSSLAPLMETTSTEPPTESTEVPHRGTSSEPLIETTSILYTETPAALVTDETGAPIMDTTIAPLMEATESPNFEANKNVKETTGDYAAEATPEPLTPMLEGVTSGDILENQNMNLSNLTSAHNITSMDMVTTTEQTALLVDDTNSTVKSNTTDGKAGKQSRKQSSEESSEESSSEESSEECGNSKEALLMNYWKDKAHLQDFARLSSPPAWLLNLPKSQTNETNLDIVANVANQELSLVNNTENAQGHEQSTPASDTSFINENNLASESPFGNLETVNALEKMFENDKVGNTTTMEEMSLVIQTNSSLTSDKYGNGTSTDDRIGTEGTTPFNEPLVSTLASISSTFPPSSENQMTTEGVNINNPALKLLLKDFETFLRRPGTTVITVGSSVTNAIAASNVKNKAPEKSQIVKQEPKVDNKTVEEMVNKFENYLTTTDLKPANPSTQARVTPKTTSQNKKKLPKSSEISIDEDMLDNLLHGFQKYLVNSSVQDKPAPYLKHSLPIVKIASQGQSVPTKAPTPVPTSVSKPPTSLHIDDKAMNSLLHDFERYLIRSYGGSLKFKRPRLPTTQRIPIQTSPTPSQPKATTPNIDDAAVNQLLSHFDKFLSNNHLESIQGDARNASLSLQKLQMSKIQKPTSKPQKSLIKLEIVQKASAKPKHQQRPSDQRKTQVAQPPSQHQMSKTPTPASVISSTPVPVVNSQKKPNMIPVTPSPQQITINNENINDLFSNFRDYLSFARSLTSDNHNEDLTYAKNPFRKLPSFSMVTDVPATFKNFLSTNAKVVQQLSGVPSVSPAPVVQTDTTSSFPIKFSEVPSTVYDLEAIETESSRNKSSVSTTTEPMLIENSRKKGEDEKVKHMFAVVGRYLSSTVRAVAKKPTLPNKRLYHKKTPSSRSTEFEEDFHF